MHKKEQEKGPYQFLAILIWTSGLYKKQIVIV